jgi:anti-anti-sigma factor
MISLKESKFEKWTIIELNGRVDAFNDRRIIQQIEQKFQLRSPQYLLFELSKCEFMSLAFLRGFMGFIRRIEAEGGEVVLLAPHHQVKRQLEIFVGTQGLKIYRTLPEVQIGFQSPSEIELDQVPI